MPAPLLSILVVDDESMMLNLLGTLLQAQGHQVGLASSGAEAVVRLQETTPDLVLTDRVMPGMDGETLAQAIKLLSPHTAVVLMSGFLPRFVGPAIDGVLGKPFTLPKLLEVIDDSLNACLSGQLLPGR